MGIIEQKCGAFPEARFKNESLKIETE